MIYIYLLHGNETARKILEAGVRAKRIKIGVVFEGEHFESAVAIALFQLLESAVVLAKVSICNRQTPLRWSCLCAKEGAAIDFGAV